MHQPFTDRSPLPPPSSLPTVVTTKIRVPVDITALLASIPSRNECATNENNCATDQLSDEEEEVTFKPRSVKTGAKLQWISQDDKENRHNVVAATTCQPRPPSLSKRKRRKTTVLRFPLWPLQDTEEAPTPCLVTDQIAPPLEEPNIAELSSAEPSSPDISEPYLKGDCSFPSCSLSSPSSSSSSSSSSPCASANAPNRLAIDNAKEDDTEEEVVRRALVQCETPPATIMYYCLARNTTPSGWACLATLAEADEKQRNMERGAVLCIQAWWRDIQHQRKQQHVATYLQALLLSYLCRQRYLRLQEACIYIQRRWRSVVLERKREEAATILQHFIRNHQLRRKLCQAASLWLHWRQEKQAYQEQLRKQEREKAALIIQTCLQNFLKRRKEAVEVQRNKAATIIQSWWKGRMCMRCFRQERAAVAVIQTHCRAYMARRCWEQTKRAASTLQCAWRRLSAMQSLHSARQQREQLIQQKQQELALLRGRLGISHDSASTLSLPHPQQHNSIIVNPTPSLLVGSGTRGCISSTICSSILSSSSIHARLEGDKTGAATRPTAVTLAASDSPAGLRLQEKRRELARIRAERLLLQEKLKHGNLPTPGPAQPPSSSPNSSSSLGNIHSRSLLPDLSSISSLLPTRKTAEASLPASKGLAEQTPLIVSSAPTYTKSSSSSGSRVVPATPHSSSPAQGKYLKLTKCTPVASNNAALPKQPALFSHYPSYAATKGGASKKKVKWADQQGLQLVHLDQQPPPQQPSVVLN
ncbi:hypothetical protein QOT17_022026 [Balamuthia mandrillaris]